jgi:hypothetical protein
MFSFYEKYCPFHHENNLDDSSDEDLPDTKFLDAFFFSFLEKDEEESDDDDDDQLNNIDIMDSHYSKSLEIITDLPDTILYTASSFENIDPETPTKTETPIIENLVEEIIQSVLEKIEISETEQIMDKETESPKDILKDIPEETKQKDIPEETKQKDIPEETKQKDIPEETKQKDIPKESPKIEQVNNPQCGFCVLQ